MKLNPTLYEEQKEHLEKELNLQKQKFLQATQNATDKFQETLALENWIKEYPLPSAALMALGGFLAAQLFYDEEPPSKKPPVSQKLTV